VGESLRDSGPVSEKGLRGPRQDLTIYRTAAQASRRASLSGARRPRLRREQLIGRIAADSKFIDERDAITEYVRGLRAGEGLDEAAIRAGYQRFKAHGVAPKSAADFAFLLHGRWSLTRVQRRGLSP
jgi:hypothetical protein